MKKEIEGDFVEIGSLADWFSTIGTISAVGVSLYLASKKSKKILKIHIIRALKETSDENGIKSYDMTVLYRVRIFNYSQRTIHVYFAGVRTNDSRKMVRKILLFLENKKNKIWYENFLKIMKLEKPEIPESDYFLGDFPNFELLNMGESSKEELISEEYLKLIAGNSKSEKDVLLELCYRDNDNEIYTIPIIICGNKDIEGS